ncbi:hypothetical protein JW998_13315 [candidate division KSB1 bacterium]|nr:hypothetical protein [candidate division KSB1 bacterium]
MEIPSRKRENLILLIISVGFIIWSTAFIYRSSFVAVDGRRYFCLFDDAMISMRYAWNFSHGLGLVWNQGENIQGYTNLLMTLLMSFATLIFNKSTAVLFMQIVGMGLMLAIAYVSAGIVNHIITKENHQIRTFIKILTFFCALSYYPLAYWSLMGMETGLLTLLLLSSVLFAFQYTSNKKISYLFFVSGTLGLAFLTRNDSIVYAILVWAYIAWESFTSRSRADVGKVVQLLISIIFYFGIVGGQLIFHYWYYGEMLPNTYTLKLTGMPLVLRIVNGVGFISPFLHQIIFFLVIASMEVVFNFQKRKLLLISLFLSALCYQIYVGGDAWTYWRMMSPFIPLLSLLFILSVNDLVLAISSTQASKAYFFRRPIFPDKYIFPFLVILLTLAGLLLINVRFLPNILLIEKPYQQNANRMNVNRAITINQLTTNNATVGVFWAGSIPYYTDRNAIDFLGRCDKYIAQLPPDISGAVAEKGMKSVPGHNKYDLNYSIKDLHPTYVQNFIWGAQNLSEWAANNYVKVNHNGISVFFLKDSPQVLWNKISEP